MKFTTLRRSVCGGISLALFGGALLVPFADSANAASKSADKFPVTVTIGTAKVTVKRKPTRIVSISPTATEILFAIGAGKQVKAVDEFSTFPAEAPRTKLSGFQPNVEAIVGYKPDLVVMSQEDKVTASLRALKIPVVVHVAAANFDDTYTQMTQLGRLTGNSAAASTSVSRMKSQIAKAVAKVPKVSMTFYHELDNTLYSVTSGSFVGQVYALFGLTNIADAAPGAESGYPQLSAEYLVASNPDLIFLADTKCCGQTKTTVSQRAGWDKLAAVQRGAIIELDDDIASRWGPRVPLLVEAIADGIAAFPVKKAA